MTEYEKKLEQFRTHYKLKYGVELDDVTLYFFVRVNEMQKDLRREIKKIPAVRFRSGWDYFLYGLGKNIPLIMIAVLLFVIIVVITKILFK
ncbi:MAG: hypothetical protein J7502_04755 [Flavisolibacter sp.]|nr:hypothetical protein [Flavisolibacter sp.]